MKRTVRKICITVFALALAGGTALAQDDDDMGGDDMGGDDMGGGGDDMGGGDMGGDTGSTDAPPPPDAAGAAGTGKLKAGAKVVIPKGFNEDGELAIGSWIEIAPWASYQVNEKLNAGVEIPLLLVSPDLGAGFEFDVLQGIIAKGTYAVNEKINGKVMAGLATQGRMVLNPYGGAFGFYGSPGDMKIGGGAGAEYMHHAGKMHISAGAMLIFQADSASDDDDGSETALLTAQIPILVLYDVNEKLTAGLGTGLYLGEEFGMEAEEGASVPVVVGARYKVNEQIGAGGFLGLGSLVVADEADFPGAPGVGDTLTLGLFASWQQ